MNCRFIAVSFLTLGSPKCESTEAEVPGMGEQKTRMCANSTRSEESVILVKKSVR